MRLYKVSLFFSLLTTCLLASQNIKDSYGPAFYIGYGNLYGGAGARFEYQIKKANSIFAFSPTIGIGAVPVQSLILFGWNTGLLFEIGHMQRGFVGINIGYIEGESQYTSFPLNDSTDFGFTKYNLITGSSLIAGYKGMIKNGICCSASLGVGAISNPLNTNRINGKFTDRLSFVYNVGVGYKF